MLKQFFKSQNFQNERILDVGSGPKSIWGFLKESNTVEEIDIKNGPQEDIRRFPIKKNAYDVIIARNVLPFLSSKEEVFSIIEKFYKGASKYVVFTLFGEKDPWFSSQKQMIFFNSEDIEMIKQKYPNHSFNYFYGPSKTMAGDIKEWEIYTFIIKK